MPGLGGRSWMPNAWSRAWFLVVISRQDLSDSGTKSYGGAPCRGPSCQPSCLGACTQLQSPPQCLWVVSSLRVPWVWPAGIPHGTSHKGSPWGHSVKPEASFPTCFLTAPWLAQVA